MASGAWPATSLRASRQNQSSRALRRSRTTSTLSVRGGQPTVIARRSMDCLTRRP